MAKKKSTDIKKLLETKRAVIGTDRTLKGLRAGTLEKVFVSANTPADIRETISYYSRLSNTELIELKDTNEELGVVCRKPFSISLIGITRA